MEKIDNDKPIDKKAYEYQWARQLAHKGLSLEHRNLWRDYNSVDRLTLNINSRLAHWGWKGSKPLVLNELRLQDVSVARQGVTYSFSDNHGNSYPVTHTPSLLAHTGIFAWVPHFNEFRHTPLDWNNAEEPGYVRVSVCLRQPSNPLKVLIDNHTYLTTRKIFEKDWASKTISKA